MDNFRIKNTRELLVIVFFIAQITITSGGSHAVELIPTDELSIGELQPVGPTEYGVVEVYANDARRRLAPFQLCLLCKCCSTNSTTCSTMPCCFAIDCQLPNKPFGVCAFVPKTCSCTSCAV